MRGSPARIHPGSRGTGGCVRACCRSSRNDARSARAGREAPQPSLRETACTRLHVLEHRRAGIGLGHHRQVARGSITSHDVCSHSCVDARPQLRPAMSQPCATMNSAACSGRCPSWSARRLHPPSGRTRWTRPRLRPASRAAPMATRVPRTRSGLDDDAVDATATSARACSRKARSTSARVTSP